MGGMRRESRADIEKALAERPPGCGAAVILLAATLLLIPVAAALQFKTLSFVPGGREMDPLRNPHTHAFIYTALLALGVLRIRPREGHLGPLRALLTTLRPQAFVWLLVWAAAIMQRHGGGIAKPGIPLSLKGLFAAVLLFGALGGTLLAALALPRSRRGGTLLLAQASALPWVIVHAFSDGGLA